MLVYAFLGAMLVWKDFLGTMFVWMPYWYFPQVLAGMNSLLGTHTSIDSLPGGHAGMENLHQSRVSINAEDHVGEGSCPVEKAVLSEQVACLSFSGSCGLVPHSSSCP